MPELPEVETISNQLEQTLKGLKITQVKILSEKNFNGNPDEIISQKIEGVTRRAKIILIKLSGGKYLAVHLKLTGQLIYRETQSSKQLSRARVEGDAKMQRLEQSEGPFEIKELPNKFTTVVLTFSNDGKLYFNDLRKFGWMKIVGDLGELGKMGKLGPEANKPEEFSLNYFQSILAKSKKPVKLVIMDQEKLAGVGNIYANEALYMAGIMPTRPVNSLTEKEIKILRDSILGVLGEAIKHRGTSDTDEAYRQITGEKGNFQNYLQIYGKKGQECLRCRGEIKWMKVGGRGTFYCPKCQK